MSATSVEMKNVADNIEALFIRRWNMLISILSPACVDAIKAVREERSKMESLSKCCKRYTSIQLHALTNPQVPYVKHG